MTVEQLKEAIKDLLDHMDVLIHQTRDDFSYSLVEQASVKEVRFQDEDLDPEEWPKEQCLFITDYLANENH